MVDMGMYQKNSKRWYQEYIRGVDLNNLKWQKLNALELKKFYLDNYYDQDENCYVINPDANLMAPLGMNYASIVYIEDSASHLISSIPNNIGKETLVTFLSFTEDYRDPRFKELLTYIDCLEVNSFFWHRGLLQKMAEQFPKYIDLSKDIEITEQSDLGKIYGVHNHIKLELDKQGFKGKFINY